MFLSMYVCVYVGMCVCTYMIHLIVQPLDGV